MNCYINNMILYNKYVTCMFYIIIGYFIITTKNKMFYRNDKNIIEKNIIEKNIIEKNNEEDYKSNHNVNKEFENWWGQFEDIEKPF